MNKREFAEFLGVSRPTLDRYFETIHAKEPVVSKAENNRLKKACGVGDNLKEMYRITKQMGLKGVTGYTFRHTIITDIYELTHDANIASAVAGHSKTTTTMNRYAHARQDAAKRGMEAIDKAYTL